MTDFDDTNRGVLFKEDNKESDKHPDYTGKVNVEGKEFRLAGWQRQSKGGRGYLSLSVSEIQKRDDGQWPQESSGYEKAKAVADSLKKDDDGISLEDIPF